MWEMEGTAGTFVTYMVAGATCVFLSPPPLTLAGSHIKGGGNYFALCLQATSVHTIWLFNLKSARKFVRDTCLLGFSHFWKKCNIALSCANCQWRMSKLRIACVALCWMRKAVADVL